ncbi:MAG: methyl-accepting chemotaxis protein [Desulfitobacteriaceae bacterium]
MRSLKQQVLILLLGSLILLATSFIVVIGWHMKDRAVAAAIIKAQTDLATCGEIIDKTYPGPWSVQDGNLYKGSAKISLNNDLVDHLSSLTGDTVTVFLGETRVATTVRGSNGERAIGTKVSAAVAQTVLQNGQTYVGLANVVGQWYQTAYRPLRSENGSIIGIFYVGISHAYEQEIIFNSLIKMAGLGLALTILIGFLTWFFLQRVIIHPLHNIMLGTRDVATGHLTQKVEVSGAKEIGELADAFNEMVERLQSLAGEINRATGSNPRISSTDSMQSAIEQVDNQVNNDSKAANVKAPGNNVITEEEAHKEAVKESLHMSGAEHQAVPSLDTAGCIGKEGLPKGLNQATLGQIVQFLQTTHRPLSAEEVAEGVKLTRVTVRRYLEFLEQCGVLKSEMKYGTVGRPLKLFIPT